ncbi:MAG TPA: pyridoxal phosphate-dependent aminotransferase [Bryobacteraceae bacterium]|nr:pyridoxal phosphate-dependent aminotransferase [Bryobacteraceae bacterium]
MFSSRLDWSAPENPLTKLLAEKRSRGDAVLDLTESNPTAAGFSYPVDVLLASLADPRLLRYEPHPAGLPAARAAVAEYYHRASQGSSVSPDQILLTASSSESYALLFKLLADPGDHVLVPRPSYPLFEFLAALESACPVQYALVYDGRWTIDFDALRQSITARTRAIVLVNPNNPTGSFLKKRELVELIALCQSHQIALISDEVFSDYAFGPDQQRVSSIAGLNDVLSFALSGFSKVLGLPQLKLGWIVISGPQAQQAIQRLELIEDTYLSVGTAVQWAAQPLFASRDAIQRQILERIRSNRAFLASRIGPASPWRLLETEGGWSAILEAPKIRSEEQWVLGLLNESNVLVQPGFFFDFEREAFLIVSLLTRPEIFQEGVDRILAQAT